MKPIEIAYRITSGEESLTQADYLALALALIEAQTLLSSNLDGAKPTVIERNTI